MAQQILFFSQDVNNLRLTSTGELQLDVFYTADDETLEGSNDAPELAGLNAAVFFNDVVTLNSVTDLLTKDIQEPVNGNVILPAPADTNDADSDPLTTQVFRTSWIDLANIPGKWPGEVPAKLYTLNFQVDLEAEDDPRIRFAALETASGNLDDFESPINEGDFITINPAEALNSLPVFDPLTYEVSLVQRSTSDVVTVVATDADTEDQDNLIYSIADGNSDIDGDGNSAFAIDGATGLITVNDSDDLSFADVPDKKFTLSVAVQDTLNEFAATNATVTVDITNAAPVFGTFEAVTLDEGSEVGTEIGTFTADPVDGDTLTYSLVDGNNDIDGDGNLAFTINSSTGSVTVNDSDDLVFAIQNTFNLSVQADDGNGGIDDASVVVNLNGVAKEFNSFTLEAGQGIQVTNVRSNSTLDNLVAVYRVDGTDGNIDGVKPGESGYVAKALGRIERDVLLSGQGENETVGQGNNTSFTNNTGGTAYYGTVLIANGGELDELLDFLEVNPGNTIGSDISQIAAYFSFEAANATRSGVASIGDNFKFDGSILSVEDLHSSVRGSGEPDFNDLTAQINFI
jgi:hypothetical protein